MSNEKLLKELKEEIRQLREEMRAKEILRPYPVYVPQPYYPYQPWYPWWGTGTVIIGNTPPTTTTTWTLGNVTSNGTSTYYQLSSGEPQTQTA